MLRGQCAISREAVRSTPVGHHADSFRRFLRFRALRYLVGYPQDQAWIKEFHDLFHCGHQFLTRVCGEKQNARDAIQEYLVADMLFDLLQGYISVTCVLELATPSART